MRARAAGAPTGGRRVRPEDPFPELVRRPDVEGSEVIVGLVGGEGSSRRRRCGRQRVSLVALVDLGQAAAWNLIGSLARFEQLGVAIRVAYVFVDDGEGPTTEASAPGRTRPRAFGFVVFRDPCRDDVHGDGDAIRGIDPDLPEESPSARRCLARRRCCNVVTARRSRRRSSRWRKSDEVVFRKPVHPPVKGAPDGRGESGVSQSAQARFRRLARRENPETVAEAIDAAFRDATADVLASDPRRQSASSLRRINGVAAQGTRRARRASQRHLFTREDARAMGGEMEQVVMHFAQSEMQAAAQAVFRGSLTGGAPTSVPKECTSGCTATRRRKHAVHPRRRQVPTEVRRPARPSGGDFGGWGCG